MDVTLRDETTMIIALGVATFYLLAGAQKQTLLAILVMFGFAAASWKYLQQRRETIESAEKDQQALFDHEGQRRKEASPTERYYVATFPSKGFTFLKSSPQLEEVAKSVVVCRIFDRARYADLLLYLDRLQKLYEYILDGRYDAKTQIENFMDVRTAIVENLYSMFLVVPSSLRHIYGIEPYHQIDLAIRLFMVQSRTMIQTLRSYMQKVVKEPYFPITLPSAADAPFEPTQARRLP